LSTSRLSPKVEIQIRKEAKMNIKEKCPDCGTGIGMPHQNGCDIERCSVCGNQRITCECDGHAPLRSVWTGEWPTGNSVDEPFEQTAKVGFVFCNQIVHEKPKPVPSAPEPAVLSRKYSDDTISKNCHINWGTHIAEPVYINGNTTGEWRVRRLRPGDHYTWHGHTISWDAIVPSMDAAMEWGRNMREEIEEAARKDLKTRMRQD
jgi:hypothetical protein